MKDLAWIGSSREDLRGFPQKVRETMGHALRVAQRGGKHPDAKPLKGFKGAGVLEVVEKSKHGIETPKKDLDLISARLRRAEEDYRQREKERT